MAEIDSATTQERRTDHRQKQIDRWISEGVEPEEAARRADEIDRLLTEVETGARNREALDAPAQDGDRLEVRNHGQMAYWLSENIGRGRLAGFFRRRGVVVYTRQEGEEGYIPPRGGADDDGPAQAGPVSKARLAAIVQYAYQCQETKPSRSGPRAEPGLFPQRAAEMVINAPEACEHLRPLRGVVHSPVIRADGSLLDAPGYDPASRLLHLPEPGLRVPAVPELPTRDDVARAVGWLDFMTGGFSWQGAHDQANYYGLLLTPLLRELAPPPYKMFGISAHQPGSGKTLLATVARIIHGGVFRSEFPGSEEELTKVLTSILYTTTAPVVHVDNVSGVLKSSKLAGMLTSATFSERLLGSTSNPTLDNDRVWCFTGNNLTLGGDLVRRTVNVALDPAVEHPEERTDFEIPDLEGWARHYRGELLAALLTLVRAWVAAGRPMQERKQSDGYTAWEATVGGILELAGVPGFFDAVESRGQSLGEDDGELATFLEALHSVFGQETFTARDVAAKVTGIDAPTAGGAIHTDQLPEYLEKSAERAGRPSARAVGKYVQLRQGRFAGGLRVVRAGEKGRYGQPWRLERRSVGGGAGGG
jgi:hypothetical protein